MPLTGRARGSRRPGKIALLLAAALSGTAIAFGGAAIAAPQASAATACVDQTFGYNPGSYQPCVVDLQVLLNDLWYKGFPGPDQLLSVDGYYGVHTAGDVQSFNFNWIPQLANSDVTTPDVWAAICELDEENGFHGAYWQNAGCLSAL